MTTPARKPSVAAHLARGMIRTYQAVASPALHLIAGPGAGCRFLPSCSEYAHEAYSLHGVFRGSWLTVRRLCKCGPWHPGGFDPVEPVRGGRPEELSGK